MEMTVNYVKETSIDTQARVVFVDRRRLLLWRLVHGTSFLLGGLCFIVGSCMYFTTVYGKHERALVAGGWIYTVGSFCFLVADVLEWSHYLLLCYFCCAHREEYEESNSDSLEHSRSTLLGGWERAELAINVFLSVCGSILYVIGSIFFIPALSDYSTAGDWLFIIGSACVFMSQCWKIYRYCCTNPDDRTDHRFHFMNIYKNIIVILADGFTGLGGVFYLVGSILFLPRFNTTDSDENRAAILFVLGGCFFTFGGFFLQYIYYCGRHQ